MPTRQRQQPESNAAPDKPAEPTPPPPPLTVHQAILAVMADIGTIPKSGVNQQQGFRFRGVEQALAALQPLLVKHQLTITQKTKKVRESVRDTRSGGTMNVTRLTTVFTLTGPDGSRHKVSFPGEAQDSADKSTSKALSIAWKYMAFLTFAIPVDPADIDDPDNESHEAEARRGRQGRRQEPDDFNVEGFTSWWQGELAAASDKPALTRVWELLGQYRAKLTRARVHALEADWNKRRDTVMAAPQPPGAETKPPEGAPAPAHAGTGEDDGEKALMEQAERELAARDKAEAAGANPDPASGGAG